MPANTCAGRSTRTDGSAIVSACTDGNIADTFDAKRSSSGRRSRCAPRP